MSHFQPDRVLLEILKQNISDEAYSWLLEKSASGKVSFNTTFVTIPRKTGKKNLVITQSQQDLLAAYVPGFTVNHWLTDRLARVWLLLQADNSDKEKYVRQIENLFLAAEVNELVALYSALPLLAFPEVWTARCSEGIRSNIGDVLEAIMCRNPYPAAYLSDPAWNQLVMKAFFTEKPVEEIVGLDKRANKDLALILRDYAHERWAAHRTVNPQIWRCVGKFIDEALLPGIEKLTISENVFDREAAALACNDSSYTPAKQLLDTIPVLKSAIQSGTLTWDLLALKMKENVLQS
ncbi:MAG: EboA domain-containing protein [Chitinophagaceae bacterium]|nr:EboA domain-containing protein [Chitinophagaceae bacterium]